MSSPIFEIYGKQPRKTNIRQNTKQENSEKLFYHHLKVIQKKVSVTSTVIADDSVWENSNAFLTKKASF